jgi:putative membrane protein
MNKTLLIPACIAVALACGSVYAQSGGAQAADSAFVAKASAAGLTEVAEGNLAGSNGASDAVKTFGSTMVTDHTDANTQLTTLVASKGITPASAPTASQQAAIDSLKALNGAAFDKRYAALALKDHQDAVALFEKEASSGKDADLRAFATKTLPTLKHHLSMAKALPGK